ncbi:uncharacterized protein F5891DRAFT_580344 [Suillus fuscotomentosus]|uniref:Uncharacterized protein n=1 Tax=Suillus fuscotomentosus TaxID=1912939 RepID=A0AAD4DZW5_9AGAM|nr:uncharacterized protein F5891DRAFT_580344 [Suillus fuscotomentosus]KAG1896626.1 hypothetical protein F5891DRAFT_580344 [Suillus fuscotomentosus]
MQQYSDDEYLSNEDPDGGEDSEGEGLDRDDDPQWGERSDEGEDPDDSEGEGLNRDDDPQWDGRPDEGEDSDDSEGEDLNRDDDPQWDGRPDEGEDSDDSEGKDLDRDERPDESEDPDDSEGEDLDRDDDPQLGEDPDESEDLDDSEGEDLDRDERPDESEDPDDSEGEDLDRDDGPQLGEHPDENEDPDDSEGEYLDKDDDPRWGERLDTENEDSAGGEDYYDGKYAHQVADQDRYEDADEEVRGDKVVDEGSGSDEDSGSDERSRSDEGSGGGSNFGSRSNGQPSHNIFTTASNAHTEWLPTQGNDSEDGNNDDPYSRRHQWQAPNRPQPSNKDVNSDYNLHSRRQPPNHPQHNEDVNDNSSHPRHQAPTRPQHTNKDVGNDHPHWHPIRALNRLLHKKDGRNNDPHPIHQPPNLPPHKKDSKKNDPHPRRQPPNHPGPSNPPRHQPSNHPGRKDLPRLPDRPGHNDFSGRQPPNRPGRKDLPQLPDRPGHNDFSGRQPPNRLGPSEHPSHQPPNHPGPSNPSPRRQPPNHPGPSNPSPRRQPPNHPGPSDPSPRRQPPNHPGPDDPPPRHQPPNRPPPKKDGNNNDPRPSKLPKPPLPKKVSNHDSHPGPQPLDHPPPNSEHGTKLKTHAKANEINGHSLYDDIKIKVLPTVWNASVAGDLHTAEKLLTQEIDKDGNKYDSCAIRSMVRARSSEWDNALQDAVKSIAIQPSLWGYISKSIALCGNGQLWDAMEAFDLAITFSNRDPVTIDLLLLIKAVVIFNAGRHNEAIRRVQRLAITDQRSDALRCSMVDAYLHVQLAMITFQNGQYSKAADKLTASIATITGLFSPATLLEPRWKIFTLLFGWDFDSLWRTINQRRCDALLHADRVTEAVKSFQYMMSMIDDDTKSGCLEWSSTFKRDCIARCVAKADEAIAASDYEMAVELYSAVIKLDPSHDSFFERRSTAYLAQKHYAQALADADTVSSNSVLPLVTGPNCGMQHFVVHNNHTRKQTRHLKACSPS